MTTHANLCACGHLDDAHRHFRRGSDCGSCGADACPRFRPVVAGHLAPAE